MSNDNNKENEAYNRFLELSKPTDEDFQRVFTEEELKELCLKHPCRVDIWRWNVVNDYRILFTQSGRYQRWSDRKRLLMLAKAVNKMKPSVLYDEDEIKKTREEEWGLQLKENILSLNYWKHKRQRALQESQGQGLQLLVSDAEEIDHEISHDAEIYTQSQVQRPFNKDNQISAAGKTPATILSSQSDDGRVLLDNLDEEYVLEDGTYEFTEMVLLNEQPREVTTKLNAVQSLETLQSEDVGKEIEEIYGVNTMSMTLNSQFSTDPKSVNNFQSQDVLSQNYDHFKSIIPLTSTQSQGSNL